MSYCVVRFVGYGNLVPKTTRGRCFAVFYSFVGIELCLAVVGFIARLIISAIDWSLSKASSITSSNSHLKTDNQPTRKTLKYNLLRLLLGFTTCAVFFILIPAVIFQRIEGWSYGDSVYFACISLTTIGFGDFVAGKDVDDQHFSPLRKLL